VRGRPESEHLSGLDEVLQRAAELGNTALEAVLPRSIGDCSPEQGAPPPCRAAGDGPLAEGRDDTYDVDVTVRWASGVDTVRVKSARALKSADAERPVGIVLDGVIHNLSLSMLIQKCFMEECNPLFDNTDGCCQPDRRIRISVAAACRDGPNGAELQPFELMELSLDRVYLKETLFGFFRTKLADLSGQVSPFLEQVIREFLSGKRSVLGLTVNEVLTDLWRYNVAGAGTCADLVGSL